MNFYILNVHNFGMSIQITEFCTNKCGAGLHGLGRLFALQQQYTTNHSYHEIINIYC